MSRRRWIEREIGLRWRSPIPGSGSRRGIRRGYLKSLRNWIVRCSGASKEPGLDSFCRKLAILLGGNVSVESRVGIGSVFQLTIPVQCRVVDSHEAVDGSEEPWTLDPGLLPVLVIEDEPQTRFVYEKFLRGTRYQPLPAAGLRQADHILLDPAGCDRARYTSCRRRELAVARPNEGRPIHSRHPDTGRDDR